MGGVVVAWSVSTEAELVARAQAGDDGAFEELIGSTQARLFSLAVQLLCSRAEAEDAVQEAYIVAYTHLDRLDSSRSPYGLVEHCHHSTLPQPPAGR